MNKEFLIYDMLINSVDDLRKILLDLRDLSEASIVDEIAKLVDPDRILGNKKEVFDPSRVITDSDYDYLLGALKNLDAIYFEFSNFKEEYPLSARFHLLNFIIVNTLSIYKTDIILQLDLIYFNNVDLARKRLDPKLVERMEDLYRCSKINDYYRRSDTEFEELEGSESRFLPMDEQDQADAFKRLFAKVEPLWDKFEYPKERQVMIDGTEINIGERNWEGIHFEKVFIGWFDMFSKYAPTDPLVMAYREKISKLPLRKIDLVFVLDTYGIESSNASYPKSDEASRFDELYSLSSEALLDLFWKKEKKIKEQLLRHNTDSTPTHVVNIIWSLLEAKDEEKEDN